jgi:hypothetical protein
MHTPPGPEVMGAHTDVETSGCSDSLHNLERVGLEVEALPHALQDEGLTRQELFSFVRERLERAPMQVLSRTGALNLKGAPTLFLAVSLSERQPRSFLYRIDLELVQGVSLERLSQSDRLFAAPTWRAHVVGLVDRAHMSMLVDQIGAAADAFANARDTE